MKSIFIMSSERSGSNLVREILNSHPNISAPPAAQLPRLLSAYLPYYDDLTVDENMMGMIDDANSIIKSHPEGMDLEFSVDEIFKALTEKSMWGLISAIYSLNARKHNKPAWASKDKDIFNFVFTIKHTLPDARFIYLFRDGRDYVCSVRKLGIPNSHIYSIAKQWQAEQQACLQAYYSLKEKDGVFLLRYEDLLVHPESTLRRMCDFLDEPFHEGLLYFHTGNAAKKMAGKSAYWENLNKPLMKTNFAKFKKELKPRETVLVESIIGRELALLGYPRMSNVPVRNQSHLLHLWYSLQNEVSKYFNRMTLKKKEPWRDQRNSVSHNILRKLSSRPTVSIVADVLSYD